MALTCLQCFASQNFQQVYIETVYGCCVLCLPRGSVTVKELSKWAMLSRLADFQISLHAPALCYGDSERTSEDQTYHICLESCVTATCRWYRDIIVKADTLCVCVCVCVYIYIRGCTVHRCHGSVHTSVRGSQFDTILVQQEKNIYYARVLFI